MEPLIRMLGPGEEGVLRHVAPEVFDGPVNERWAVEFLRDSRHHLAVAIQAEEDKPGLIVGMASAVHYIHPDKPPELWINEAGVAPSHQGRGLGRRLIQALLAHGRSLGCRQAWVLTEESNTAARRLYAAAGGVETPDRPVMFEFPLEDQECGE